MIKFKRLLCITLTVFTMLSCFDFTAFAALKSIDDEYFKFYASYEDEDFKADNVVIKDKKWSTKENQKKGDWFVIDLLKSQDVGQVVIEQGENCFPLKYNVYAAKKRENLVKPIIENATGKQGASLIIDFPEIINCRFIKIELADETEGNANPWEIINLKLMSSNEQARQVRNFEAVKSDKSEKMTKQSALMYKLGIDFEGYGGSRADFAKILTEFYGIGTVPTGECNFLDVKAGDKNYDYIMTLAKICKTDKEKMFYPDKEITVAAAMKYILDTMGYSLKASLDGGYPTGYMKQAIRLGIVSSDVDFNSVADRQTLEKIIYNALFTPVLRQTTFGENSEFSSSKDLTCAYLWHNLKKVNGILVSTFISSITGNALVSENHVMIENSIYRTYLDADEMLGCSVIAYVLEEDGENEIIYLAENAERNTILTVPAENIVAFSDYTLEYLKDYPYSDKTIKAKVDKKADMIYGGAARVPFDTNALKIKNGYLKLIDNNGDGKYDVVAVNEYVNYTVSYTDEDTLTISDYYGKPNVVMKANNAKYTITKDGMPISFADIHEGNIVSVIADKVIYSGNEVKIDSLNSNVFRLVVSDTEVVGEVTSIDNGENIIYVDGRAYFFDIAYGDLVARGLAVTPRVGELYRFRMDAENKICDIQYRRNSATKYGLLVDAEIEKNKLDSRVALKILTTENVVLRHLVYEKVLVDGTRISDEFSVSDLKNLFWEDVSVKITDSSGGVQTVINNQLMPQVIGYTTSEDGEIRTIDTKRFDQAYESRENSIQHQPVAQYTCNTYRGMVYPTDSNSLPNMNYTGKAPIVFVGPLDSSSANPDNDYAVYSTMFFEHDGKYQFELFKKSEFNDLEIAFIHADASDASEESRYVLVDKVITELTPEGEVKSKVTGYRYGERYEAYVYDETTLNKVTANGSPNLNRGDLISVTSNSRGDIMQMNRLVDVKNPGETLKLSNNGKYYNGQRDTIGQVYNASNKNLLVTSLKRASDSDAEDYTELFMLPETALCYDERTDSVNIAKVSDILAYKKTNDEKNTSILYAYTSWGLHQSFIIYNFKDFVPEVK